MIRSIASVGTRWTTERAAAVSASHTIQVKKNEILPINTTDSGWVYAVCKMWRKRSPSKGTPDVGTPHIR